MSRSRLWHTAWYALLSSEYASGDNESRSPVIATAVHTVSIIVPGLAVAPKGVSLVSVQSTSITAPVRFTPYQC